MKKRRLKVRNLGVGFARVVKEMVSFRVTSMHTNRTGEEKGRGVRENFRPQ